MLLTVNLVGLLLIAFIVWWFWLAKSSAEAVATQESIEIIVENGIYVPDTIKAKQGQTVTLSFRRKDPSACAEAVIFADFEESLDLPLDKPEQIQLTPDKTGEFEFTCPMGMYRGTLVVE